MENVIEKEKRLEKKYHKIYQEYQNKYQELKGKIEGKISSYQYGKGADMHRGYYCPSPIDDIIIGNIKRGRILKRRTKKYDFEYCFDINGRLICINRYFHDVEAFVQEILIYENSGEVVLGLIYDTDGELEEIVECEYEDDKIIRYDYVLCSLWEERGTFFELTSEEYVYQEGKLMSAKVDNMLPPMEGTREEYCFYYENDEISFYTMAEYCGVKKTNYGDGMVFDIKKKKVYDIKDELK